MRIFETGFGSYTCDGATIEATRDGVRYVATVHHDSDHDAPWDEECGHGPVTDWTRRDKLPGELLLAESRGAKRFYDYAEACRIARRDGWGYQPGKLTTWQDGDYFFAACEGVNDNRPLRGDDVNEAISALYASHRATMSPREYAARAARHDFEVLRAWCNDDWTYCGIAVQAFDAETGAELCGEYDYALWGIEMNYPDSDNAYLLDVANEHASEIFDSLIVPRIQAAATIAALATVNL